MLEVRETKALYRSAYRCAEFQLHARCGIIPFTKKLINPGSVSSVWAKELLQIISSKRILFIMKDKRFLKYQRVVEGVRLMRRSLHADNLLKE